MIIHKFHMEDCQPKSLPADPNSRLVTNKKTSLEENAEKESFPYR
jgi:hypothetical protein